MCPISYYQIMENCKDKKQIRYQMLVYAEKEGIKPAARAFKTSPPVIRKWKVRYQQFGYQGLEDLSRKPKNSPRKISDDLYKKIKKMKIKKYKRD